MDLDLAAVMAEHHQAGETCAACMRTDKDGNVDVCRWPCLPYRLAETLESESQYALGLLAGIERYRTLLAASEASAALDLEMREVLWARVNRVLAEGGDKIDAWWLRGLLQHRDQHDDPENTDCSITAL